MGGATALQDLQQLLFRYLGTAPLLQQRRNEGDYGQNEGDYGRKEGDYGQTEDVLTGETRAIMGGTTNRTHTTTKRHVSRILAAWT